MATADIAAVAAPRLLNNDWSGKSALPLSGSEDLTTAQAVERVSEGVGRPIGYVRIPTEGVIGAFAATGAHPEVAKAYATMLEALSSDRAPRLERTPATTSATKLASWSFENLRNLLG
ncbi:MAG: hypothetical protein ACOYON_11540 [Fimbriimonas sp.]